MIHTAILQPTVVNSQQLIVVLNRCNIKAMTFKEKYAFAARMSEVADMLKIPPKGKNRQKLLGDVFGVSQESARKWLEGESFPTTEKCIEIAKMAKVHYEWFMTGRGPKRVTDDADYRTVTPCEVAEMVKSMDVQAQYELIQLTLSLVMPPAYNEKKEPDHTPIQEDEQRTNDTGNTPERRRTPWDGADHRRLAKKRNLKREGGAK